MTPDLQPFDQEDPSDLRVELAKLRMLLAASDNVALQRSLIDSIRGCAAEYDKQQARRSLYVHKNTMFRWVGELIQTFCDQLQVLSEDQRNSIIDNVVFWMTDERNAPENDPAEIKALTGREYSK